MLDCGVKIPRQSIFPVPTRIFVYGDELTLKDGEQKYNVRLPYRSRDAQYDNFKRGTELLFAAAIATGKIQPFKVGDLIPLDTVLLLR